MTRERVIDKVKKLLNTEGRTEAEVVGFLAKAQMLMLANGLTQTDLEVEEENDLVDNVEYETGTKGLSPNISYLAVALSRHYRVLLIRSRSARGVSLKIIGDPNDVKIFKEVMNYCVIMQEKLFQVYLKTQNSSSRSESIRIKNTYLDGFRKGVDLALTEQENQYALVVVPKNAVVKYVENLRLGSFRSSTTMSVNDEHRSEGMKDGKSCMGSKKHLN